MRSNIGILLAALFFAGLSSFGGMAASTSDIVLTEDTFSATSNNESTGSIVSESILMPIQRVGSGGSLIERAHELSVCGNAIIEFSEKCDKTSFGGQTCATYGKNAGSLACSSDCKTIITTDCRIELSTPTPSSTPIPTPTATPLVATISPTNTPTPTPISTALPTITPIPPIPTIPPFPTPTSIVFSSITTSTTGGSSGNGGGYDPLLMATPSTIVGDSTMHSSASTQESGSGVVLQTTQNNSNTNTSSHAPWLENGVLPASASSSYTSPWLENGETTDSTAPTGSTSVLPFEEWRQSMGLDALPSSDDQKDMVTKHYISYVQSQLERGKVLNPVIVANMLDGAVNPERHFGDAAYWQEEMTKKQLRDTNGTFHSAASNGEAFWKLYTMCEYPWMWLIVAFLLGMIAQYILYFVLFSKKYEK